MRETTLFALIVSLSCVAVASARGVDRDSCQQSCRLELVEGQWASICECRGANEVEVLWGERAAPEKKMRRAVRFLRRALPGVTEAEWRAIRSNACTGNASRLGAGAGDNAALLRAVASQAQAPLCACVEARVHFPVARICRGRANGSLGCEFRLQDQAGPARERLRSPTLEDYQTCLARRRNYVPPETCREANCASAVVPACAPDQEAVNLADKGACCPVFACRPVGAGTGAAGSVEEIW